LADARIPLGEDGESRSVACRAGQVLAHRGESTLVQCGDLTHVDQHGRLVEERTELLDQEGGRARRQHALHAQDDRRPEARAGDVEVAVHATDLTGPA